MESYEIKAGNRAAWLLASAFGSFAGLGGIRHAIGEILQGNIVPSGIVIESWAEGPIATNMGGEPGMTIIPNMLVTGLLGLAISVFVLVWSIWFVRRKNGGRVLLLLSILMLLFGGGFGPPIIGILAGVAGLGIRAPLNGWRTRLPAGIRRFLASLWPWVFLVAVLNGLFLFVLSAILVFFFQVNNPDLFLNSFYFAVGSLLIAIFTGIAFDGNQQEKNIAV